MSLQFVTKYNNAAKAPEKAPALTGLFCLTTGYFLSEKGYGDNMYGSASVFEIKPYLRTRGHLAVSLSLLPYISQREEKIGMRALYNFTQAMRPLENAGMARYESLPEVKRGMYLFNPAGQYLMYKALGEKYFPHIKEIPAALQQIKNVIVAP